MEKDLVLHAFTCWFISSRGLGLGEENGVLREEGQKKSVMGSLHTGPRGSSETRC